MPATASTVRAISTFKVIFSLERRPHFPGENMSFIHLMWSSYGHGFSQQLRRVRQRRGFHSRRWRRFLGSLAAKFLIWSATKMACTPWPIRSCLRYISWPWPRNPAGGTAAGRRGRGGRAFDRFRGGRCRGRRALPARLCGPASVCRHVEWRPELEHPASPPELLNRMVWL